MMELSSGLDLGIVGRKSKKGAHLRAVVAKESGLVFAVDAEFDSRRRGWDRSIDPGEESVSSRAIFSILGKNSFENGLFVFHPLQLNEDVDKKDEDRVER